MSRFFLRILVLGSVSVSLLAQNAGKSITNDDVLSMKSSGLSEQTMVLAIQQAPTVAFDTSPQALVGLKKAGISDAVLNAMLVASRNAPSAPPEPSAPMQDGHELIEKVLASAGPMDKLTSITAMRVLTTSTQNRSGSIATFQFERTVVYPDRLYIESHPATGPATALVITPQFVYAQTAGQSKTTPSAGLVDDYMEWIFPPEL